MKKNLAWIILALLATIQFMVVLDVAIANVALPAIKTSLGFSEENLQWVITAYALTFGGMLLLGGRMADLFGRKRMLLIGLASFTLFSLLIGTSQSAVEMVIFRALQGIAAAFMSPSALAIVLGMFHEGKKRGTALGIWSTVGAGGAAIGLVIGGILTTYLNWRWNFFVNVPVGILALIAAYRLIPKDKQQTAQTKLDMPGAVLITAGLMTLVYGLTEAPVWGWLTPATIATLAGAVLLIAAFIYNESRASHPLMPLSIFRIRNVSIANAMITPVMASMMGMFFLLSIQMQRVYHFDPIQTGLGFLLFPTIVGIISNIVPRYISRFGFKRFLVAGPGLLAIGLGVLSIGVTSTNFFIGILPALVIMAVGMGLSFVSITMAATSGVPANESGLASGLLNTSQQMGGALGLAVLSGIATASAASSSAKSVADASMAGNHSAFIAATIIAAVAFGLSLLIREDKRPARQQATGAVSEPVLMH